MVKKMGDGQIEIEVPDANFYLQVTEDHLEEAEKDRGAGKRRDMHWQCLCASNAIILAIQQIKTEPDTEKKEALLKRAEILKKELEVLVLG